MRQGIYAVLILFNFISHFERASLEIFSSTTLLQKFIKDERLALSSLDEYIRHEEERIERLKGHVRLIRLSSDPKGSSSHRDLENAEHPIDAYQVIKRWSSVQKVVQEKSHSNVFDFLDKLNKTGLHIPESSDLDGALAGVIRLQHTYGLSVADLSHGKIEGHRAIVPMGGNDYYQLGVSAIRSGDAGIAAQWLRGAVEGHNKRSAYPLSGALAHLSSAYSMMGHYKDAKRVSRVAADVEAQYCFARGTNASLPAGCLEKNTEGFYISLNDLASYKKREHPSIPKCATLCKGETGARDPALASRLVCVYRLSEIPYLRYKEEIYNFDPRIVLFHDVISDRESDMLKDLATPLLTRATVAGTDSKQPRVVTKHRIGQVAWLYDDPMKGNHSAEVRRLSQRVEWVTGLSTTYRTKRSSSEAFQVLNYGIAGHFASHHDFYQDPRQILNVKEYIQNTGDRIATFILYLSEPLAGGGTVFPQLGVKVPAIKNGASFWYNLRRSGSGDLRTEHAGCPVLLGQKWIATKWIRQFGQEFRRQCGLTENDVFYT